MRFEWNVVENHNLVTMLNCDRIVIFYCYDTAKQKNYSLYIVLRVIMKGAKIWNLGLLKPKI